MAGSGFIYRISVLNITAAIFIERYCWFSETDYTAVTKSSAVAGLFYFRKVNVSLRDDHTLGWFFTALGSFCRLRFGSHIRIILPALAMAALMFLTLVRSFTKVTLAVFFLKSTTAFLKFLSRFSIFQDGSCISHWTEGVLIVAVWMPAF